MPTYNAESTLERTWRDVPRDAVDEIILVDDASRDRTVEIARRLGLTVIEHAQNRGYGGNQKTCYRAALERPCDVVAMVHPDYQYDARLIPLLVGFIDLDICDVVLGSRIRSRAEALSGRMPLWKYFANRALTMVENVALGQNLGDFHSDFRVYARRVLETIPFEENSDDFVFDSQFLAQAVAFGFRIGDVPVPARYFPEASSIGLRPQHHLRCQDPGHSGSIPRASDEAREVSAVPAQGPSGAVTGPAGRLATITVIWGLTEERRGLRPGPAGT
jgi:glycosyltransferase involved in cell wall biosynthesis